MRSILLRGLLKYAFSLKIKWYVYVSIAYLDVKFVTSTRSGFKQIRNWLAAAQKNEVLLKTYNYLNVNKILIGIN